MHLDVRTLRNFYYRSALGRTAQRIVRDQVVDFWPDAHQQTVIGFGFAVPLLRPYLQGSRRVIGLMPAQQGVMAWPPGRRNVSVLCEETMWPIETGRADKLVVLHGLETSERPFDLLEECWRVLGPGGRALFIVPNRSGLWARTDATPFGYGRPYSLGQLENQLKHHAFVPERHVSVLYQPPSTRRFWMKTGRIWEQTGRRFSAVAAGGVLMIEVSKRTHPPKGVMVERARQSLTGLVASPTANPA